MGQYVTSKEISIIFAQMENEFLLPLLCVAKINTILLRVARLTEIYFKVRSHKLPHGCPDLSSKLGNKIIH
jgi:hypothetical protein